MLVTSGNGFFIQSQNMDKLLTDVILSDKFSRLKGRIGGDKCFAQFQEIGTL